MVYVDTGFWDLSHQISLTSSDQGGAGGNLTLSGSLQGSHFSGRNFAAAMPCFYLNGSDYIEMANFTAESSPGKGIYATYCDDAVFYQNICRTNTGNGLDLFYCDRAVVEDNISSDNSKGLYAYGCDDAVIRGNTLRNSNGDYNIHVSCLITAL